MEGYNHPRNSHHPSLNEKGFCAQLKGDQPAQGKTLGPWLTWFLPARPEKTQWVLDGPFLGKPPEGKVKGTSFLRGTKIP